MTRIIATFGGLGLLRPGPGTWASLAALPLGYGLHWLGGFPLLLLATVVLGLIGYWATATELVGAADKDPAEIVVDEVVGRQDVDVIGFPLHSALRSSRLAPGFGHGAAAWELSPHQAGWWVRRGQDT